MAKLGNKGENAQKLLKGRACRAADKEMAPNFTPYPGWARSNPDLAFKLLFIAPQHAPWVDEILGGF